MVIKRIFKGVLFCFLALTFVLCLLCAYAFISPTDKIQREKLEKNNYELLFFDCNNNDVSVEYGGNQSVDLNTVPDYVVNAFIAVEDKRFFKHNGVDFIGMARALKNNVIASSFKEGGSTITQQLIKNTHLSSEKTISRKINEIKLALKLERTYTKAEILSFYLNGVYFGEGAYGIESASKTYFAKRADQLTLVEACALASTVKAPAIYNPRKQKCNERKNLTLKLMREQGYISNEDYQNAIEEDIVTRTPKHSQYLGESLQEAFDLLNLSPYQNGKVEIYTYFDKIRQSALNDLLTQKNQGGIIMSSDAKIKAYKIPEGDFERQPASTIKPLIVYAPAIEEGIIHIDSKILDEPCNFNGYAPSNYGNKYYGWISAKNALCKSLNVPAVKIIDALGTQKARLYARKLGFEIKEEGLGIALGSYNGGVDLQTLCASYATFSSLGNKFKPTFINKIIIDGKVVYKDEIEGERVFSKGCAEIINEALKECCVSGTAKAIGKKKFEVCAKTGTAGNEYGNTDAYSVCYTSSDVIAVRFCNKDNSYLQGVTTGAQVCTYTNEILNRIYAQQTPPPFEKSNEVIYAQMCTLAYEKGALELGCENQPNRYLFTSPILKKYIKSLPISSFSAPLVVCNFKVENNKVVINIQKSAHVACKIERIFNGKSQLIYNGYSDVFTDDTQTDGIYYYKITPYVISSTQEFLYGEEIVSPALRICVQDDFKDKSWWEN